MDDGSQNVQDRSDPLERARTSAASAEGAETLTLAALAAVAGLSPYHFARQFTARFGISPMAFVREQRMALAASRLTGEKPPALVELAFDLGFESQEGFTRAFKRAFGVSPGRYRRKTHPAPEEIAAMSDAAIRSPLSMQPAPVLKPGFRVAGFSGVFDDATRPQIPLLWERLIQRLPLAGQIGDDASFGVCSPAQGEDGCFNYLAGVPIAADAAAPEGLEVMDVPAQTYLVFRQDTDGSPLNPQMQAAVKEIWGERVPKSGFKLANVPDIEAYPPGFEPDRPSHVEWWIPVEG
ncbi:MAG TPA: helix-turn-helix domain-containing protein [Caulobacteraceae bacterium]|nr:helix-turn-helix domain-containing protein [Caulobacteraceae bacterium]